MGRKSVLILLAASFMLAAGCGRTDNEQEAAREEETNMEIAAAEESDGQMADASESREENTDAEGSEEAVLETEKTPIDGTNDVSPTEEELPDTEPDVDIQTLPGASLNGNQYAEGDDPLRVTCADGFYYEPISDALKDYITGTSYPETSNEDSLAITCADLRYVHVLYCDFNGESAEGELICNASIAQDLTEIFHELYENGYQIEQIHLVDEYGGDDDASMAADNTSCFNYRNVPNSGSLSNHALGRAIDVNPLYNPYITYNSDGSRNVSPAEGAAYADRSADIPHKIDQNDLCYQLFTEHGFTWGGSWNSSKDYQHFEK